MDPKDFVNEMRSGDFVLRLAHYTEDGTCDGRGTALVIDPEEDIAIMVEDCGFPEETGIPRGAIVRFAEHPEAEPRIVGEPAFVQPISVVCNSGETRQFGRS